MKNQYAKLKNKERKEANIKSPVSANANTKRHKGKLMNKRERKHRCSEQIYRKKVLEHEL